MAAAVHTGPNGLFVSKLLQKPAKEKLVRIALRDCLHRYESLRRAGRHDGPPIQALRLYLVHIHTDRPLTADSPIRGREFLAETGMEE